MPLHRCTMPDGSLGWQWGESGKKYKSKLDAIKQMKAIFANGYREPVHKKACLWKYGAALNLMAATAPATAAAKPLPAPPAVTAVPGRVALKANRQLKPVYTPPAYLGYDSLKKLKPNSPLWLRLHHRITKANNRTRLVRAIIQQLSKGNPMLVGPTNDYGLAQITPIALKLLQNKGYIDNSVTLLDFLYDPDLAVKALNFHIDELLKRYPGINPSKLYAMYNLGLGKFKKNYSGKNAAGYRNFKNVQLFKKHYNNEALNIGKIPLVKYNAANYTLQGIPWQKGYTFQNYYYANPELFYGIPYETAYKNFLTDNPKVNINLLKAGRSYNIRGLHKPVPATTPLRKTQSYNADRTILKYAGLDLLLYHAADTVTEQQELKFSNTVDVSKLKPGSILTLFFNGAKTSGNAKDPRSLAIQSLADNKKNFIQQLRYGDLQQARLLLSQLPAGVRIRLMGYSAGGKLANKLALLFRLPVSLIDPITVKKNYVPWADIYLPQNNGDRSITDRLMDALRVTYDKDNPRHRLYAGNHHLGISQAISQAYKSRPMSYLLYMKIYG